MSEADPSLEGVDIICLGTAEWRVLHSVPEYTMLGFSRTNRVLFVEPFASWITLRRMAQTQARQRKRKPRLEQVGQTLWVYRPPAIGLPGLSRWHWTAVVNGWILNLLLRHVVRQLGFKQPVLWSYIYSMASLIRNFPARLTIYECGDHDAALTHDAHRRRLAEAHETIMCRTADLVFAVTEELAAPRRVHNPHTYAVNAAAAIEFFGRALLPETRIPDDIARLPHPVIGYLGGIDPWKMDVELLLHLARQHPEWSIALVGFVLFGFDLKKFSGCSNIHVLGPKDYDRFPEYLKGMDVCIMPFPLNDITRNGDALKLYEYLAGGRAVISTSVPAARRFPEVVRIAETPATFVAAVEAALADPPEAVAKRVAAVRPHSWEARNRQKAALIQAALARKS